MENKIKETTEKLNNGTITKDEADKILLDLFVVSCSSISRGDINKQEDLVMSNINDIKLGSELSLAKRNVIMNSFLTLQGMYHEYLKQNNVD